MINQRRVAELVSPDHIAPRELIAKRRDEVAQVFSLCLCQFDAQSNGGRGRGRDRARDSRDPGRGPSDDHVRTGRDHYPNSRCSNALFRSEAQPTGSQGNRVASSIRRASDIGFQQDTSSLPPRRNPGLDGAAELEPPVAAAADRS